MSEPVSVVWAALATYSTRATLGTLLPGCRRRSHRLVGTLGNNHRQRTGKHRLAAGGIVPMQYATPDGAIERTSSRCNGRTCSSNIALS